MLTETDVAIGISHTGTTIDVLDALRVTREHGATTIGVTNFAKTPIAAHADLLLTTAARGDHVPVWRDGESDRAAGPGRLPLRRRCPTVLRFRHRLAGDHLRSGPGPARRPPALVSRIGRAHRLEEYGR